MNKFLIVLISVFIATTAFGSVTGSLEIRAKSDNTVSSGMSTAQDRVNIQFLVSYTNGTGTTEIDTIWNDQRSLASSASEILTLDDGSLTDPLGQVASFTTIRAVAFQNTSTTETLTITTGLMNDVAATTYIVVPGGFFAFSGEYSISALSNTITVSNSTGATSLYNIWLVGTSE